MKTIVKLIKQVANLEEEKKEEIKKQEFTNKMSKIFKKLDYKFEFTPEEIIMFYV